MNSVPTNEHAAVHTTTPTTTSTPIVFAFPNFGGRFCIGGLYEGFEGFRKEITTLVDYIQAKHGINMYDTVTTKFGSESEISTNEGFRDTWLQYGDVLHFCVCVALGRFLRILGVRPAVYVGVGIGECAAACLAGACEAEDMIDWLIGCADMVEISVPRAGGEDVPCAAHIQMPHEQLALIARQSVALCEALAPNSSVVAAFPAAVDNLLTKLTTEGVPAQRIPSENFSITSALRLRGAECAPALRDLARSIAATRTHTAFASSVTGELVRGTPASGYWVALLTRPAYFSTAVAAVLKAFPTATWVEVGGGSSALCAHITQCAEDQRARGIIAGEVLVISTIPTPAPTVDYVYCFLHSVNRIARAAHINICWDRAFRTKTPTTTPSTSPPRRSRSATIPQTHGEEQLTSPPTPPANSHSPTTPTSNSTISPTARSTSPPSSDDELDDLWAWEWKAAQLSLSDTNWETDPSEWWIVFDDGSEFARQLVAQLDVRALPLIIVISKTNTQPLLQRVGDRTYAVSPTIPADYVALRDELMMRWAASPPAALHVINVWSLLPSLRHEGGESDYLAEHFSQQLLVARLIENLTPDVRVHTLLSTPDFHVPRVGHVASLWGLCKDLTAHAYNAQFVAVTLPKEWFAAHSQARAVPAWQHQISARIVLREAVTDPTHSLVAYTNTGMRYVRACRAVLNETTQRTRVAGAEHGVYLFVCSELGHAELSIARAIATQTRGARFALACAVSEEQTQSLRNVLRGTDSYDHVYYLSEFIRDQQRELGTGENQHPRRRTWLTLMLRNVYSSLGTIRGVVCSVGWQRAHAQGVDLFLRFRDDTQAARALLEAIMVLRESPSVANHPPPEFGVLLVKKSAESAHEMEPNANADFFLHSSTIYAQGLAQLESCNSPTPWCVAEWRCTCPCNAAACYNCVTPARALLQLATEHRAPHVVIGREPETAQAQARTIARAARASVAQSQSRDPINSTRNSEAQSSEARMVPKLQLPRSIEVDIEAALDSAERDTPGPQSPTAVTVTRAQHNRAALALDFAQAIISPRKITRNSSKGDEGDIPNSVPPSPPTTPREPTTTPRDVSPRPPAPSAAPSPRSPVPSLHLSAILRNNSDSPKSQSPRMLHLKPSAQSPMHSPRSPRPLLLGLVGNSNSPQALRSPRKLTDSTDFDSGFTKLNL